LAMIAAARAQTVSGTGVTTGAYQLRGTADQASAAPADAESTLYGTLPVPRPQGAIATSRTGEPDAFGAISSEPAQSGNVALQATDDLTGSIGSPSDLSQADQEYAASLARQNARTGTVDGLPLDPLADEAAVPGFSFGSLTLR